MCSLNGEDLFIATNFIKEGKEEKKGGIHKLIRTLHNKADLVLSPDENIAGRLNIIFGGSDFGGQETRTIKMHVTKGKQQFMLFKSIFTSKTGKLTNTAWVAAGTEIKSNAIKHVQSIANQMAVYIVGWYHSFDPSTVGLIPAEVLTNLGAGLKKLCAREQKDLSTAGSLGERVTFHRTRHMLALKDKPKGWSTVAHNYDTEEKKVNTE